VKTGEDGQAAIRLDNEHKRVRELSQESSTDIFVDDREVAGVGADLFDHCENGSAETSAQAWALFLVPILRLDQLRAGEAGKDNRAHLRATLNKLRLQLIPANALEVVLIERLQTTVKLGLLRNGQRELFVFDTVPKLRDKREALGRCQSHELVVSEYVHSF
jgi:hypothetical protein